MNDEEQVPVSVEIADSFESDSLFISAGDTDAGTYTRLTNMSAGFI